MVTGIESPAQETSKWISKIIKKVMEFKPKFAVKNYVEVINRLKEITPTEDTIMFSLDVKNLFPSIKVEKCRELVEKRLEKAFTYT